jgi:xylose isomerase
MEILGLAIELKRAGYGANGERIGFDLFPYTEDPVAAVRRSILHWEFIRSLADRVDLGVLRRAQRRRDAVACYGEIYRALGLDDRFLRKKLAAGGRAWRK